MERGWSALNLGDGVLAMGPLNDLEARFLSLCAGADPSPGLALFGRHGMVPGQLHCEVWVYFPPAVAEFAQRLGALPCERPGTADLTLLAGDERAWRVLFPDG